MPVSLVNSGNSGRDRIRPGMDRARERDRLPRKLFPINRSLGIDRPAASSARLRRGNMARAGKTAPAAPNPLTKPRRLTGTRPLGELPPGAMLVLLAQ